METKFHWALIPTQCTLILRVTDKHFGLHTYRASLFSTDNLVPTSATSTTHCAGCFEKSRAIERAKPSRPQGPLDRVQSCPPVSNVWVTWSRSGGRQSPDHNEPGMHGEDRLRLTTLRPWGGGEGRGGRSHPSGDTRTEFGERDIDGFQTQKTSVLGQYKCDRKGEYIT